MKALPNRSLSKKYIIADLLTDPLEPSMKRCKQDRLLGLDIPAMKRNINKIPALIKQQKNNPNKEYYHSISVLEGILKKHKGILSNCT